MYMPFTVDKDEYGKEILHYHGIKKSLKVAMKRLEGRKGYIKDYNTKEVVFQNILKG
jgi:hypothetical protein